MTRICQTEGLMLDQCISIPNGLEMPQSYIKLQTMLYVQQCVSDLYILKNPTEIAGGSNRVSNNTWLGCPKLSLNDRYTNNDDDCGTGSV